LQILNGFSTACVTFLFSFWFIREGIFEKEEKQDAESSSNKEIWVITGCNVRS
jgi:hypothetical protein